MQDRYAGDIGDFVKLALLRELSPGHRLGVVWYRVLDESHNADGRHVKYLARPEKWRHLDSVLFDQLEQIVKMAPRSIEAIEDLQCLRACKFFSEYVPMNKRGNGSATLRAQWVSTGVEKTCDCDLVFFDPDNGIEPEGFRQTHQKSIKSATFEELKSFQRYGRSLIVYHHHTRRKGGHLNEIGYNADRFRQHGFHQVDALRSGSYSPRVFFLLNATEDIRERSREFARKQTELHGMRIQRSEPASPRGSIQANSQFGSIIPPACQEPTNFRA